MTHIMTAPNAAAPQRPKPAATPSAAVIQIPAAVVRPCMSRSSLSLSMAPPPINPMPGGKTLNNARQIAGGHPGLQRGDNEERRAERDQHMRPHPSPFAGTLSLDADHGTQ